MAEDLFQEVWMRVLVRGAQFNGQARFDTWLFTIARNLVIDQRRKRTMSSLDELFEAGGDDDRPMSFEVADGEPTPFDRFSNLEDRERIAGGADGAGHPLSRGAGAALPRGVVAGRDRQGHQGAAFYRKIKTVPGHGGDQAQAGAQPPEATGDSVTDQRWGQSCPAGRKKRRRPRPGFGPCRKSGQPGMCRGASHPARGAGFAGCHAGAEGRAQAGAFRGAGGQLWWSFWFSGRSCGGRRNPD